MMTAGDCRKKADEAEALSRIVSLHTDKARLTAMATDWRRRAAEMEARPTDAQASLAPTGPNDIR